MIEIEALNAQGYNDISFDKSRSLTWKCKFFSCRNEELGLVYYDKGEHHGLFGAYGACETVIWITYWGCPWCKNYERIVEEEPETTHKWVCDCSICKPLADEFWRD